MLSVEAAHKGWRRGRLTPLLAAASLVGVFGSPVHVAAQSGETGATAGIIGVPAPTCATIRNQIAPGFSGDWIFACYGDETTNPSCGLFSTADIPGQTNLLGYCQDSFPAGVAVRQSSPAKTNVRLLATSIASVTGVSGLPSLAASTPFRQSNVLCLDFDNGGGPPDQEVCIKIDPRQSGDTAASATQCPAGQTNFIIKDGDCSTVQGVVTGVAGASSGNVAFAWLTDVGTLGQPGSEGVLICPTHKATCVQNGIGASLATAFPGGVRVRYSVPLGTVEEQPDCKSFRGRLIC